MQKHANPSDRAGAMSSARPRAEPFRVLVVDDEADACEMLRQVLEGEGYDATLETSALGALQRILKHDFDLVLSDVAMVEMDGIDLCRHITEARPELPVILVTGRGSMSTAIEAFRTGARDFLTKPVDAASLTLSVARALRSPARRGPSSHRSARRLGPTEGHASIAVLGQSPAMRQLNEHVADLSGSVASVIIQGETGSGKELVARAIHASSRLRSGPFMTLNCAAMPAGLLESELFGRARGAFTDARSARAGLLVEANGGTLLLDEIGELPLLIQTKLLRALQERTVRPVGEHEEIPFDCRIIAATSRDLDVEVSEKRFREDLYYRIDVVRLTVPPLRTRGDDILLLVRHFLERFAASRGGRMTLGASAAERLMSYGWPGNVRELENCIERAATLSHSDELSIDDLPEKVRLADANGAASHHNNGASEPDMVSLSELERRHILRAIKLFDGNKTLAAELLGIDRSTLYRRLERYGLDDSN